MHQGTSSPPNKTESDAAKGSLPPSAAPGRPLARMLRKPILVALTALVLRLVTMTAEHTYQIKPGQENYSLGWETGKIAYSIATGQGFSSPFQENTGPTAWVAPLYPYLVAGVFKILGIYSPSSIWVLLAI